VFVLAYLLGVVTFGMYDVCAQWARPGLRRLVTESLSEIAYGYLRTNGSFSRHGVSIIVKGVRGDLLLEPLLTFEPGDGKPLMTLAAQEARLQTKAEAGILRVECRNGQLEVVGKVKLSFPDWREYDLEINPPIPDRENHASPSELGCGVIPRQIRREQRLVAELEPQLIVARQASLVRAADLAAQLKERRARLFRLQAEIPRRLANGFGCVCFALLGVPVAMWRRSADTMSVFFLCFVPILVIYYPLLVTGENLSRSGVWPLFSVWLADAVLLVIGIGLLTRMMRH
jgi:lipopolysaccharide export system permease protein